MATSLVLLVIFDSKSLQSSSPVGEIHFHPPDDAAALAMKRLPWVDVGMVIKLGDDDFIAGLERAPQGARGVKRQRRGVGAEDNLRRRRARKSAIADREWAMHLVGFSARREIPVRIRVMAVEVVGHGVDDRARRLRTARAVEICHRQTVVQAVQGGEIRANFIDRGN